MGARGSHPGGPPAGGEPLAQALDGVLEGLAALGSDRNPKDGIFYSGNRHESVPRRLYHDRRLTPLERNAWTVVRLLLRDEGVSVMPTYEELRPYLATTPGAMRASEETVARALTILRLTRWLSLVRHRRDPATGRFEGSIYVLHDEPLTPYETVQLDASYLELVGRSLTHASKAVRDTGRHTLREISEDPLLRGRVLPSRLEVLVARLANAGLADEMQDQGATDEAAPDHADLGAAPKLSTTRPQATTSRSDSSPSSESEGGLSGEKSPLRNPKPASTVRTVRTDSLNKDLRTVPRAREDVRLRLPGRLCDLRAEQREGALAALRQVEAELQQLVLDEWDSRCRASTVRNPAAYLFGLIQRALRGEFRAWASCRSTNTSDADRATEASPQAAPSPDETQSRVAALQRQMRIR